MVNINKTHVFITGGYDENGASVASYIYNGVEFIQVPDMSGHRFAPGCGLHDEHVFVVGGYVDTDTSEVFSLKTLTWSEGPKAPSSFGNGLKVVSIKGTTYILGNTAIYRLSSTGENSWDVIKVTEWDKRMSYFDAIPMDDSYCIYGECIPAEVNFSCEIRSNNCVSDAKADIGFVHRANACVCRCCFEND